MSVEHRPHTDASELRRVLVDHRVACGDYQRDHSANCTLAKCDDVGKSVIVVEQSRGDQQVGPWVRSCVCEVTGRSPDQLLAGVVCPIGLELFAEVGPGNNGAGGKEIGFGLEVVVRRSRGQFGAACYFPDREIFWVNVIEEGQGGADQQRSPTVFTCAFVAQRSPTTIDEEVKSP